MEDKIIKTINKLKLKNPSLCKYYNERINDAIDNYGLEEYNTKVSHLYTNSVYYPNPIGKFLINKYGIKILRKVLRNIDNLKKINNEK